MSSKFIALLITVLMIMFTGSYAQAPDTVDVPFQDEDGPLGAINRFIQGDTTAAGERNNIHRTYKLANGAYYLFNSAITCNYPISVWADPDGAPPILARGILEDNTAAGQSFTITQTGGMGTFKNLYFMGLRPDGILGNGSNAVQIRADSVKVVIDNCVFDAMGGMINENTNWGSGYVTNCHIRNAIEIGCWFCGNAGFYSNPTPNDTIVIMNNTFFNWGSYGLVSNREWTNYIRVEHNTYYLNHVNVYYAPYPTNAVYKNNIYFGMTAMGIRPVEQSGGWFDWDAEVSAIFSIDTLPPEIMAREGMTEAERRVVFHNNAYFWPQQMVDFWANSPYDSAGVPPVKPEEQTLTAPLWVNERTQGFIDNVAGIQEFDNWNMDPQFNDPTVVAQVDSIVKYTLQQRNFTITDYRHYYFGPGQGWTTAYSGANLFPPLWPVPEKLTYDNATLKTASDWGLPLGDLNWYPESKAIWEANVVGIKAPEGVANVPGKYALAQNYPNPFNPQTKIEFHIAKPENVKLTVFNTLGQKVITLVDQKQEAGEHVVTWKGVNETGHKVASGIYYYRLESGDFLMTKKMMLLK
jgi:hypothetical protein